MSSEIGLNDAKPGMWIEFDDADGHYAGELHEMKDSEDIIHFLILSMSDRPPLYIETEDEGNLVILIDFGDGYRHGSARNVHVYESKPEMESVKQAEDDGGHQFWEGKTCKEMAGLYIKVTFKNGDVVTGVTNQIGDIDSVHYLSAGTGDDLFVPNKRIASIELVDDAPRERITDITKVHPGDKVVMKNGNEYTAVQVCSECSDGVTLCLRVEGFGFVDALWAKDSDFQYAYREPYTMADLPKEPGFYKARTKSVWKYDGRLWAPMLNYDGEPASSHPTPTQNPKHFLKSSIKAGRFPFTKVEASFE